MPSLLDGMNVAFRRAALKAGTYPTTVKEEERGDVCAYPKRCKLESVFSQTAKERK
jgi:hypothetical protein